MYMLKEPNCKRCISHNLKLSLCDSLFTKRLNFFQNMRISVDLFYERVELLVSMIETARHKLFNFGLHQIKYSSHTFFSLISH